MIYPTISIVTSCYNHKDYIAETIESVLSQGYPNLQYVVIDDGSTDGSWDIIQKYKDRLHYCERLEGYRDTPTIAINHGMKKTSAEIMGWLNSDDVLLPHSLFTLAHIFSDLPKVEWLTGAASTINTQSELVESRLRCKSKYDFLCGDWKVIQQESTFFKRTLWERTGATLNGEKKWAFDTELWTRFFEQAEHYHSTALIGAFRKGKQSKSVRDNKSFLIPNMHYLTAMRTRSNFKTNIEIFLYKVIKLFHIFFALIPHRVFCVLPVVQRYSYSVVHYMNDQQVWKIKKMNPFRKKLA